MILHWKNFIESHPANADYNKNLAALQSLIPESENDMNSYRRLADNKFIVCITKGQGPDAELQATFNHTMLRKSFTDTEPTCVALIGFGNRASAVKVTPKEVFRQSPKIKIPKFSNLIKSDSIEDILALQRENQVIWQQQASTTNRL